MGNGLPLQCTSRTAESATLRPEKHARFGGFPAERSLNAYAEGQHTNTEAHYPDAGRLLEPV